MSQPINLATGWNRNPGESIWSDTPKEWRRHSYGSSPHFHTPFDNEVTQSSFPMFSAPNHHPNSHQLYSQDMGQHLQPLRRRGGSFDDDHDFASAITEYFGSDPHQRVQVTRESVEAVFDREKPYLAESHQLPKFPMEKQLGLHNLCIVEFKAGRVDVFYMPKDLPRIVKGDLVIVEADRGKDLGRVAQINSNVDVCRMIKLLQIQDQQRALTEEHELPSLKNFHAGQQCSATLHFPKPIIGLASKADILHLLQKKQEEDKACRLCLTKISAVTSNSAKSDLLQMRLVDAEYQFDRKKLIFYYSTSKRIDFRDLVRELFRIYKTRIWMCAVTGLPYTENTPASPTRSSPVSTSSYFSNYTIGNDLLGSAPKAQFRRSSLDDADPLQSIDELRLFQPSMQQSFPPFGRHTSAPRLPGAQMYYQDMDGFMLKSLVDSINH